MSNRKDPKKWMNDVINTKSPTFCGAKWFNATVWLGNGMTASCHHPPPHQIDPEEVKINHKALHNTPYKKLVRKEMQDGKQTRECDYCWKIESMGDDVVSDRFYKSKIYTDEELAEAANTDWKEDVSLKTMEIAFDNNCNFACSYCNAGFSTTWAHDINKNGAYQDLKSDGWGAFAHNGDWANPYRDKDTPNPYVDAFWKWWNDELQYTLTCLRVTGGEPTMSRDFWKLIEWYNDNPTCKVGLGINSNLGIKRTSLDKLINASQVIDSFELYTSNESIGVQAEYIRDGMVWTDWLENLEYTHKHGQFSLIHVMLTLNALCLGSLDKLLEAIFDIRESYTDGCQISFNCNILRFPSFQSITTLPTDIRQERATHYRTWLAANRDRMSADEIHGMERLIAYIEQIDEGHDVQALSNIETRQRDFHNFYKQYDKRRNKNFGAAFAEWPEIVTWYDSMANTQRQTVDKLIEAKATDWGRDIVDEVIKSGQDNGLI